MIPPSDAVSLERTLTRMLLAIGVSGPPMGFLSSVYWAVSVSAVDIDNGTMMPRGFGAFFLGGEEGRGGLRVCCLLFEGGFLFRLLPIVLFFRQRSLATDLSSKLLCVLPWRGRGQGKTRLRLGTTATLRAALKNRVAHRLFFNTTSTMLCGTTRVKIATRSNGRPAWRKQNTYM